MTNPLPTVADQVTPVEPEATEISLCELGPCVHFHLLRTKLDAQTPQDGSHQKTYTNITRTCYPHSGIEMDVSDHPVRECSLWDPRPDVEETRVARRRSFECEEPEKWAAFKASWAED